MIQLPDGSGAHCASLPLPTDHWIYHPASEPPVSIIDRSPQNIAAIREAAQYAIRCATMGGTARDFDPDALVQNLIVGLCGYNTVTRVLR
jgi:hypothetical protein